MWLAEAAHGLGEDGTGLGGQHGIGVAEVVPAGILGAGGLPGWIAAPILGIIGAASGVIPFMFWLAGLSA